MELRQFVAGSLDTAPISTETTMGWAVSRTSPMRTNQRAQSKVTLLVGLLTTVPAFGAGIAEDCRKGLQASMSPGSAGLESKMAATRCMIYVKGVVDSFALYRDLAKSGPVPICLPEEGGNVGELAGLVGLKSLQDEHAAALDGAALVYATLAQAHRCQ